MSDIVLVDVRTPEEFKQGHFNGSLNIPLQELSQRVGELDRTKKIILACHSGNRSGIAANWLKSQGFLRVENAGPWQALASWSAK